MTRLKHSLGGSLRAIQISQATLVVFVEGKNSDRYFYGKICEEYCAATTTAYQIRTADELPNKAGGKDALVKHYNYLNSKNELDAEFKGKRTIVLFFLDKDIDDVLGTLIISPHVCYTKNYDVEGHIVEQGHLSRAIAASASLDESEVAAAVPDATHWRKSCAETWRDWIIICIFCRIEKVKGVAGYGLQSQVNDPKTGQVDVAKVAGQMARLRAGCQLTDEDFDARVQQIRESVDAKFAANRHGEVFKGKWYAHFAAKTAKAVARGRAVSIDGMHVGLLGSLAATIDFQRPWTDHFTGPLDALLN